MGLDKHLSCFANCGVDLILESIAQIYVIDTLLKDYFLLQPLIVVQIVICDGFNKSICSELEVELKIIKLGIE